MRPHKDDSGQQRSFDRQRDRANTANGKARSDFDNYSTNDRAQYKCAEDRASYRDLSPIMLQKVLTQPYRGACHMRGEYVIDSDEAGNIHESGDKRQRQRGNGFRALVWNRADLRFKDCGIDRTGHAFGRRRKAGCQLDVFFGQRVKVLGWIL